MPTYTPNFSIQTTTFYAEINNIIVFLRNCEKVRTFYVYENINLSIEITGVINAQKLANRTELFRRDVNAVFLLELRSTLAFLFICIPKIQCLLKLY